MVYGSEPTVFSDSLSWSVAIASNLTAWAMWKNVRFRLEP